MSFIELPTIEKKELLPGYKVKFIHSDKMTFAYWDIEPGYPLPEHSHHHEQVSHVIEGEFELTINGETKIMKAGSVAIIPSHATHSGKALTKCKVMDIFCPVRDDYKLI